ncbi:MAG: PKD domain-containing protein [Flavobacteriales bacterium]|nr:PKD domain-containing protein [Flavobacteriales bacterium]
MRDFKFIFLLFSLLFSILFGTQAVAQYQINGDASQISCNCYQLTPDLPYMGGSVWNVNQINLTQPFDYNFEVWLDCSNWGADGIAFVLQPVNINQGGGSSSLGYGGITPSLVIELDTWPNDVTMMDPQEDHIAIMRNGDSNHGGVNNLAGPVVASSTLNNIEDCGWHTIRITWQPSLNTLAVFFDGVFRTSYTADIINTIFGGASQVYWGWTGGTGSESADQRFCNAILPSYTVSSSSTCAGDPITFQNSSQTSSGNITNFSWNFGDGSTGSGAPVTHTYAAAGTYNVTMTITTEGCTEDTVIPITIKPVPVVDLGVDKNLCIGSTVQLNNPNTLGTGTYVWSPGTALSSTSIASPISSATVNTNYTLTFIAANGCSDSDVIQVLVNPLPTANAGLDQTMCEGDQEVLQAAGGISYGWTPATSLSNAAVANPTASPNSTTTYTVTATDANNCTDTDDVTITVVPAPTLDAGQNENVCEGDVVQLNAIGTGTFLWTPATGLSSTSIANPIASPTVTTTYRVTVTDGNNCSSVDSVIVDVDPIPVADFSDPTPVCNGNAVQFNDNSTGTIVTYDWDFGDGTTGTGTNPTHVYPDLGTYTVTLTTTSANGCFDVVTGTAQVIDGPIPVFTLTNGPEFCEQEMLEVTNASFGPIVSYLWDFGDGSTSTAMIPNFAYSAYGGYTVTLTVGTADQCFNSITEDISVHPIPVPGFSSSPACFGETTNFTDLTTIPEGTVSSWEWDFGDGSNLGSGQTPSHSYTVFGEFMVQLVAESAIGCSDTLVQSVFVNPTPVVTIDAADVCLGEQVNFINTTIPSNNTIVQWNWDFGDGQSGNAFEPNYQYSDFGNFTAQLTAVSDSGCVGTSTTDVEVYPFPIPAFSTSDIEGCAPVSINFENQSTIDPNYTIGSFEWNFGDGATSISSSTNHVYNTTGIYDISLIVTTQGGGCADTLTIAGAMAIYVTPTASFNFSPTNATMLDPRVRFNNTTINGIDYEWNFGDGSVSFDQDPMNAFPAQGDYWVTLTAINGICSDTTVRKVNIDPETFIYIPNSFTPDNNRVNDGFIAKGIGIKKFEMTIFNKWGEELYFTASIDEPWDGTYQGKVVPQDTYVYFISIIDVKNESRVISGSVNVIR